MTLGRLKSVRNRCHNVDQNTETVNIVHTSSDGYAGYLAASLYSLLDHNRNIPRMDIYILPMGMSEVYLERLADIAGEFCHSLYVAELGNLRERFDYAADTRGFDIDAMRCLFAPEVLPDSVRKTLHLDCGTIVNGNIRPLYKTKLGNHLVGMVMGPTVYRGMKESIGMKRGKSYYNSGILFIDLEVWRNQDVLGQLLGFYRVHQGSLFACNQGAINRALRDRIMTLPVRYNYSTNCRYFRCRTLVFMCGAYRAAGEDGYRQVGKAPVIIHYLGNEGPWVAGSHNHFRKFYEYYLDETPWKEAPEQGGRRLYVHMWWVFSRASLICPAFRLRISRRLGMRLADSRRKQKVFGSGKRYG